MYSVGCDRGPCMDEPTGGKVERVAAKPPGKPKGDDDDELLGHARSLPPWVPDAEYCGVFMRVERGRFERRERLFLWFAIATPGPYLKEELYLACLCPENGGAFGLGSKLVAAYAVAVGSLPKRKDRISTTMFKSKIFRFRTRTVSKDKNGDPRPQSDHYSVIDKLVCVETT